MRLRAAALALALALTHPATADEIADAIGEARQAYAEGDLAAAKQALDLASQLIAQKNAEVLATAFPEPLAGWTADEPTSNSAGAAMFGGGIQASRTYTDDSGDTVEVQIIGDSPLLSQWLPMISNAQLAGALGKLIRVGKARAIQGQDGQITMVVGNRFLVMVSGTANGGDKLAYAQAIETAKLEGL